MGFLDRASQDGRLGRLIDGAALLFFALFVIGPLFFIFTKLGRFTFSNAMLDAIGVSFGIGALVAIADVAFGVPLAWLLARKKLPFRGLVDAVVDLPLIIPTSAIGLSAVLFWGASGIGILQPGLGLVILLHIAFTFSYVVRTAQAAITEVEPDLGRAASSLGASPLLSFRTVWMPLFWAGVVSGAILAFTRSLGETGATIIAAGALKTVPVLTVYFKNSTPPDMDAAVSLSAVFLLLSAGLFLLVQHYTKMRKAGIGRIYADAERRLSARGRVGDWAGIAFLALIVLLPSVYFLRFSDFDFFAPKIVDAIAVSFGVAAAATGLSVAFGLPLAMFIAAKKPMSAPLKLLVDMGLLMPTVTIGLSLSLFWTGRLDEAIVLVLAHVAMVFPYFVSPVSEILSAMDAGLVEVARSLGARPFYAFRTIVFPLIKPTIIAGTVVAFMRSVSETGGTLAVSKTIETIPLLIVNLNNAGNIGAAASAAALLLAVSLALVFVLRNTQKKTW